MESGVTQGSILDPLLFIIYMNDPPDAVLVLFSKTFLFADDTNWFKHEREHGDMNLLQNNVNCLSQCTTTSHLSFHPSKSILRPENYAIDNNTIPSLPTHKNLSVIISNNL